MSAIKRTLSTVHRRVAGQAGRRLVPVSFLALVALLVAACGSTPAPAIAPEASSTPVAEARATATALPAPTDTPLPMPTATELPAPTATPLPAPTDTPAVEPTAAPASSGIVPSVSVADQALAGDSVTIADVVSDGPGWLVIHAQADGKPGPILGYSPVSSGENRNVVVRIDLSAATATLYAMLHTDAGTVGTWEFPGGPDTPVAVDGQVVSPAFQLQALSGEAEIEIEDFAFHPKVLVIRAGTTVKWANKDNVQHTTTADNKLWDSGYLSKGDTFNYTFAQPGVYPYYCIPHGGPGGQGMSGTVVVLK
jgi:plastocyanin